MPSRSLKSILPKLKGADKANAIIKNKFIPAKQPMKRPESGGKPKRIESKKGY